MGLGHLAVAVLVLGAPAAPPSVQVGLLAPTLASFASTVEGGGAADDLTRRALADLKSQVVKAFVEKDRAALERIYADDYVATDARGETRTKREELARLGAGGDTLVAGRYDVVSVRVWGDVAVMSGHGHLTWRNADGSTRPSDYYSFNVFERRSGEWKYVAAFLP